MRPKKVAALGLIMKTARRNHVRRKISMTARSLLTTSRTRKLRKRQLVKPHKFRPIATKTEVRRLLRYRKKRP